jgi:hypothetical protein
MSNILNDNLIFWTHDHMNHLNLRYEKKIVIILRFKDYI